MAERSGTKRAYVVTIAVVTLVGLLCVAGGQRRVPSSGRSASPRATRMRAQPTRGSAPWPMREAPPRAIDCTRVKCIALTFDDGPVKDTARLLQVLRVHQVRATFFLIGQNAMEFPDMVRKELADGHELGNHTWSHANLVTLSTAGIESQLTRTQAAVRKATGVTPQVFRPPYGSTNARVAAVARGLGLSQFLWEVDPLDWRDRNSATVERRVVRGAQSGDIVLMHDIHPTTVTAVPSILDRLAAKGFVFVTVSELFAGQLTPGRVYTRLEPPPSPSPSPARSSTPPNPSAPPAPPTTTIMPAR